MLRDEREEHWSGRLPARNVLGEPLELCSIKPMTGFYRGGVGFAALVAQLIHSY